jgi:archaemetzincin
MCGVKLSLVLNKDKDNDKKERFGCCKLTCKKICFITLICGLYLNTLAQVNFVIQPIGIVDTSILADVIPYVSQEYHNAKITIHKPIPLPQSAFYKPRNRYRAEKILHYLDSINPDKRTKIIGFTSVDISTTKDDVYDWGIFGLGSMGGSACIFSTFRLFRMADEKLKKDRLRKLVVHELGHTFDIDHCEWVKCVMTDYKGTMASVDETWFHLCADCRRQLNAYLGKRAPNR